MRSPHTASMPPLQVPNHAPAPALPTALSPPLSAHMCREAACLPRGPVSVTELRSRLSLAFHSTPRPDVPPVGSEVTIPQHGVSSPVGPSGQAATGHLGVPSQALRTRAGEGALRPGVPTRPISQTPGVFRAHSHGAVLRPLPSTILVAGGASHSVFNEHFYHFDWGAPFKFGALTLGKTETAVPAPAIAGAPRPHM